MLSSLPPFYRAFTGSESEGGGGGELEASRGGELGSMPDGRTDGRTDERRGPSSCTLAFSLPLFAASFSRHTQGSNGMHRKVKLGPIRAPFCISYCNI